MKKIKVFALFMACIMMLALISGCSSDEKEDGTNITTDNQTTPDSTAEKVDDTIIDMTGREIKMGAPAEKIVALTASDCEIIYALGAGSTIVGRGEYCDYPEEVLNVISVQSGSDTNIEQVIALGPQAVLMSTMAQTEEQIAAFENAGIQVIVTDAQNIEGVYTAIELIGKVVGKNDEAKNLITEMKQTFKNISDKVTEQSDKTVYFEVSPLQYGLWTAGSGTFMNELTEMVGLKNAFSDVTGWGAISQEQVIERDPDYIITITMYFGEGPLPVDEIIAREGWGELKAVKNGKVFNADSNELSRPGPRLASAAETLYSFVYENN
ncbi:MAG: ABC transporter substrate-binding protein [Eubacteriales bacterium]